MKKFIKFMALRQLSFFDALVVAVASVALADSHWVEAVLISLVGCFISVKLESIASKA